MSHRLVKLEAVPHFLTFWGLGVVETVHKLWECSGMGNGFNSPLQVSRPLCVSREHYSEYLQGPLQ